MNDKLPTLRWATGGLLIAGVLARVLGLVREMLIANYFGLSNELDAVYLGIAFPMAVTLSFGGGISTAVVPIAAALERTRLASMFRLGLQKILLIVAAVVAVLFLTAPWWTHVLVMGSGEPPSPTLVMTAQFTTLAILGGTLAGWTVGILNARGRHVTAALNLLLYNTIIVSSIFLFHSKLGPLSLMLGIVIAEWAQLAIQCPVAFRVTGSQLVPEGAQPEWDAVTKMLWPTALIALAISINTVVDRAFADTLEKGAVAALTYAERLVILPVGLLGGALAVPLFTRLSHFANKGVEDGFENTLLVGMRLLLLTGAPAAVLLAGVSMPLIGILFERGEFTLEDVKICSRAMSGYAAGVPFQAMTMLLVSAALAKKRSWATVVAMVSMALLNGVLDWIFVNLFDLLGIALSTSFMSMIRILVMLSIAAPLLLRSRLVWIPVLRTAIGSGILAVVLWVIQTQTGIMQASTLEGRILALAVGSGAALITAAILWYPLIKPEWTSLTKLRQDAARELAEMEELPSHE